MSTILIIDDENAIRATLRDILEYEDYHILDVDNGIDGLELLQKQKVDLVLCDIKMNKMDGLEVLASAQELKKQIPFIMISGHGTIETAVQAVKIGAVDFLEKPFDLDKLLSVVSEALS